MTDVIAKIVVDLLYKLFTHKPDIAINFAGGGRVVNVSKADVMAKYKSLITN